MGVDVALEHLAVLAERIPDRLGRGHGARRGLVIGQFVRKGGDGRQMVSAGPPPGDIRQQIQDLFGDPAAAGIGKPSGLDGLSEPGEGLIDRAVISGMCHLL